jgi:hypothetical protein
VQHHKVLVMVLPLHHSNERSHSCRKRKIVPTMESGGLDPEGRRVYRKCDQAFIGDVRPVVGRWYRVLEEVVRRRAINGGDRFEFQNRNIGLVRLWSDLLHEQVYWRIVPSYRREVGNDQAGSKVQEKF